MRPGSCAIAFLATLLAACASAFAADGDVKAIPALTARVSDYTGTLDPAQRQALEDELAALEKAKGAQVGVLIVPTTQPEDIAQYGIRVGEAWKLGRKGTDDGVILIVAKDDRRVRIEVGRGLEGAIPDAAAARIIREYIAPRFRNNDYYGGVHDAVGALTKLVNDEPLPPPLTEEHGSGDGGDHFAPAIIAAWFVALFLRGLFGGAPAGVRAPIVGLGAGGVGWLLSGLLPLGVGLGVFGLVFGLLGGGGGGGFANRGGWGGFGGGGGWSSGGGGWSSGGGGFSGGGGGFSGGGASGSW
ncbi:MAG: TPM domain-containing protein [Dokdonella sp.]|uniref:TPM domain-containing protein n=1 Tax=Dokdonella sp. TaxID=2291710 RepID=UPI003F817667